jgi:hypothetical protein
LLIKCKGERVTISANGWANKENSEDKTCACLTWQKHWVKYSQKKWPEQCSVAGCTNKASVAAHIHHPQVAGEKVIPMCIKCTIKPTSFSIKGGIALVSANRTDGCG